MMSTSTSRNQRAFRYANMMQALSRSRLDEWQSQENQRQQDYTTAVEQHAAQKARLLAAAAEKQAEVQRLEADAEGRQRLQAELRTQQQQLFVFKQALVEQMQQVSMLSPYNCRFISRTIDDFIYSVATHLIFAGIKHVNPESCFICLLSLQTV